VTFGPLLVVHSDPRVPLRSTNVTARFTPNPLLAPFVPDLTFISGPPRPVYLPLPALHPHSMPSDTQPNRPRAEIVSDPPHV
jgi:hypothetical protein